MKCKVQDYINNILLPNGMDGYSSAGSISRNAIEAIEIGRNDMFWKPTELTKAILRNKEEFTKMVKDSFISIANEAV